MAATPVPETYRAPLNRAVGRLRSVTETVVTGSREDPNLPGAVSTDYLDLTGHTIYAWLWARMAGAAGDDEFGRAKRRTADFYYARLLPKTLALEAGALAGSDTVMGIEDSAF